MACRTAGGGLAQRGLTSCSGHRRRPRGRQVGRVVAEQEQLHGGELVGGVRAAQQDPRAGTCRAWSPHMCRAPTGTTTRPGPGACPTTTSSPGYVSRQAQPGRCPGRCSEGPNRRSPGRHVCVGCFARSHSPKPRRTSGTQGIGEQYGSAVLERDHRRIARPEGDPAAFASAPSSPVPSATSSPHCGSTHPRRSLN
jgi:hypothetical protein